jgi:hypothetical protein
MAAKAKIETDDLSKWPPHWLEILPPAQAQVESTMSWDTIKRHHGDKIIYLSPRRVGIRRGHVLMLALKMKSGVA